MWVDERLREGLEGLDGIETVPRDAVVDSVLSRGRRKRWIRRITATGVALAAAVAALVVAPKVLNLGAGEPRPATPEGGEGIITTVAGTGASWSSGDGGPATRAEINAPSVIGFDARGNLYLADGSVEGGDARIRRIAPSGVITTVVGPPAVFGDAAPVGDAVDILGYGTAVDSQGSVYVATEDALVKVTPAGDVSTVAGTGNAGCSGDGRPATKARLNLDYAGVAVDADGNIYITQFHDHCVRKIDTNGIISTIAGTGEPGFSGDGGPALEAQLKGPTTVSLDTQGNVFVSDAKNHRIRRIDTNGIITTVAGNGQAGFPRDGAVATEVPVGAAEVHADADGNIYITDEGSPGIFRVDTGGILTILAGTGVDGYSGDGGPATDAQLSEPTTVALGPDGDLYIADWGNNRIRKVEL